MAEIINLTATTELQAVNAMLSAIGEQPVASVDTARADVGLAINTLRDAARDVQRRGWKFNTEFGLAVSPTVTNLSWTDPDGEVKTLYVFEPGTDLCRWSISRNAEQADFDVSVRPSKEYEETALPVLVFYDRKFNRDGFEAAELKDGKLWIDAVVYFNFEQLPDTARRYIVIKAMRQFIIEYLGDDSRARFTAADEARAERDLIWDQGEDDEYNLLQSPDIAGILGDRYRHRGIGLDLRSAP